jgi:GTP-binding protein Era
MVGIALDAMKDVDVVALVVDASVRSGPGDDYLLSLLARVAAPAVLVLSKVDLVAKPTLLPLLDRYRKAHGFADFVPVSARDGTNVDTLGRVLIDHLPEGEPLFPPDHLTSQTERFFVAELVREQVLRLTHDELPFSTTVIVDRFEEPDEPTAQTRIGAAARAELERELDRRVHLELHVKVKADWRNSDRLLDEVSTQNREG